MNAMNQHSSSIAYRPEIDGLRAIAVVPVVLFHAELAFPGGFVGVDIFFVISGYLIGSIINNDIAAHRFSFAEFWTRRIRRIFPALFTMIAGVLAIGYCVLDSGTLKDLGASTIWQSAMLANVFFARQVEYFATTASYQPLLHTWSLAVEEQFYIVLPFALVLLSRCTNRTRFMALAAVFAASVGLSWFCAGIYPSFAFYLLPCRTWELLAGVMLAIVPQPALSNRANSLTTSAGLALIAYALFFLEESTSFPGIEATIPVAGAAAFIACSDPRSQTITSLIASKVPIFIGQVSYSFYLWHWPLIAIGRGVLSEFGPGTRLLIVVVSFVIAVLQWRFIEQPCRTRWRKRHLSVIFSAALVVVVFGLIGGSLQTSDTPGLLSQRVTDEVKESIRWIGNEYHHAIDGSTCRHPSSLLIDGHDIQWQNGSKSILVWGDSHGMMLGDLFEDLGKKFKIPVHMAVAGGQLPLPKIGEQNTVLPTDCVSDAIFHYIATNNITDVVLVSRWSGYHRGKRASKAKPRTSVDAESHPEITRETSKNNADLDELTNRLRTLASLLSQKKIALWVLLETPDTGENGVAAKHARALALPGFNRGPVRVRTRHDYSTRQDDFTNAIRSLVGQLNVIDHLDTCFDSDGRTINIQDNKAVYRDAAHLTKFGAKQLVGPAMTDVFASIAN